jgi:hypothetical protein
MSSSLAQIAYTMDPAYLAARAGTARNTSLRELLGRHRWEPASLPRSTRAMVDRHTDPATRRIRFLQWNTYLLSPPLMAKRLVPERAREIGTALAGRYDLLSLCEVWDESSVEAILAAWGDLAPPHIRGNSGGIFNALGDGLLVISPGQAATKAAEHSYDAEGIVADSDKWAEKGVLLTKLAVGEGNIELFSTHLFSGDVSSEADRAKVRAAELREFVEFFKASHDPRNVAIFCGDLNINAGTEDYRGLRGELEAIRLPDGTTTGFDDFWLYGVSDPAADPLGGTNRDGDGHDPAREKDFSNVCRAGAGPGWAAGDVPRDFFCDDRFRSDRGRIDFIFVEQPQPGHTINLDLARIRRRTFGRPDSAVFVQAREDDREYFLSDHLALDTLLIASPRR